MLVSYEWLKEFVEIDVGPQELAERLTMAGFEVEEVQPFGEDYVLNVKITANRPDCLSILGLAREIAAIFAKPLHMPKVRVDEEGPPVEELVQISLEADQLCPRYGAKVIFDVEVGESPDWMKRRLEACGLRPINNVVDVTNYVLLELGHPLHAFDYDKLAQHKIIVRLAENGEKLRTLDGELRELDGKILVIADAERAVALAGIMGGEDTEVTYSTKNVLLEGAYFHPGTIRRGARALRMSTEASYRFERGADPNCVPQALDRAAQLIKELAGGKIAKGLYDAKLCEFKPWQVELRPERADLLLGFDIPRDEMEKILKSLGLGVSKKEKKFIVEVPTFRQDLKREADLIEELVRIYGYEKVPSTQPRLRVESHPKPKARWVQERVRALLLGAGLCEVMNFSLIDSDEFSKFPELQKLYGPQVVPLRNPMSKQQDILRPTLIPSLLGTVARNLSRRVETVKVFEIGKVFLKDSPKPREETLLGIALCGFDKEKSWDEREKEIDIYGLKGVLELVGERLRIGFELKEGEHPYFEKGACAELFVDGAKIGVMGKVREDILEYYDVAKSVFIAEIDFSHIVQGAKLHPTIKPLPKFPEALRDISLVVKEEIKAGELIAEMKQVGGELVEDVRLFDLYRGKQIPPGFKSLTFSITFRASDRTLTDEEVDELAQAIVKRMETKFGAKLRGGSEG